jgi:hypothetical protein
MGNKNDHILGYGAMELQEIAISIHGHNHSDDAGSRFLHNLMFV